jgi:Mlc titration factor MtfA (ptsG expression regulator)
MSPIGIILLIFFIGVVAYARSLRSSSASNDSNPPGFELYAKLLDEKFPYFRLLNDREQHVFVSRLRYIRNHKNFRSRDTALVITEEMEILFSAALTQLTFGLSNFDLESFTELQLTATTFYSRLIEHQVKGLTFESGRVILSWADFEEGYRIVNDKMNLGLHELAHALWITFFEDEGSRIEEHFREWNIVALRELKRMEEGSDSKFFRDYAATNIEEFWACCVECFFEAPVEFKTNIPDLYAGVCRVLNQDMAARVLTWTPANASRVASTV